MPPGHFKSRFQFFAVQGGQRDRRPALSAPGIGNRCERLGIRDAFQFLLVGGQLHVRRQAVGGERGVVSLDLECRPVEVRSRCRSLK